MKKQPENIEAFNALIKKYEEITLAEVEKIWFYNLENYPYTDAGEVARELTGFGSIEHCTLCLAIEGNKEIDTNTEFRQRICPKCVYSRREMPLMFYCNTGKNRDTYLAIDEAHDPEELLEAFKNRAKFLRKKYSKYVEIQSSKNSVS